MKISKVASGFKRDPKTIKRVTDDYPKFFTDDAKREEDGKRTQRFFHMEDLEVINSIFRWEYEGMDADQIRSKLEDGVRERDLPPEFTSIDGENALTVYAELKTMRQQIDLYERRITEITNQFQARIAEQSEAFQARIVEQNKDFQARIGEMNDQLEIKDEVIADLNEKLRQETVVLAREAERWKTRYDMLKEQIDEKEDSE